MNPLILIPARMGATRLPGKPLADIGGRPMIVRAWSQAARSGYRSVVVAGDAEIVEVVHAAGGEAVVTDPALPSGSDRIRAGLEQIDPDGRHDVIVNLQGDMPFAEPDLSRTCVSVLSEVAQADIATLVAPEAGPEDRGNVDVVKAILALEADGARGRALYFTRSTLFGGGPVWRHVGIYAYRRDALVRFCDAPPSPLERREKLEQLRALELGLTIWAAPVAEAPISVDNPQDLEAARALV